MPPHAIVEDFDVLEEAPLCVGSCGEVLVVDQFLLERGIISLHCAQTFFCDVMVSVRTARSTQQVVSAGPDA